MSTEYQSKLGSYLTEIQLLPALPEAWKTGHVKGLVARGGFETEMFWKEGKLTKAYIISKAGEMCKIRTQERITVQGVQVLVI